MDKEKILYIGMSLSKDGYHLTIREFLARETKGSYVFDKSRVSKDKIMRIDTKLLTMHNFQAFYTYCLPEQERDAVNMLRNHLIENIEKIKLEVDAVYSVKDNKTSTLRRENI